MRWEHEMVKLVAGLVMGENPMVKVGNVVGVKTWKGRWVVA